MKFRHLSICRLRWLKHINIQLLHHLQHHTQRLHKPVHGDAQHAVRRRAVFGPQDRWRRLLLLLLLLLVRICVSAPLDGRDDGAWLLRVCGCGCGCEAELAADEGGEFGVDLEGAERGGREAVGRERDVDCSGDGNVRMGAKGRVGRVRYLQGAGKFVGGHWGGEGVREKEKGGGSRLSDAASDVAS